MNRAILGLLVAATASCAGVLEPRLGQEFRLGPGGEAVVTDAGIRLRFLGVVADSRCPADAVCVWEGDAAAALDITSMNASAPVLQSDTLHTALDPKVASVGSIEIVLVGVEPARQTSDLIGPDKYIAILVVRPLP